MNPHAMLPMTMTVEEEALDRSIAEPYPSRTAIMRSRLRRAFTEIDALRSRLEAAESGLRFETSERGRLTTEARVLRSLPVLRTCEHCRLSCVDGRTPKGKGMCAAATLNPAHGYIPLDGAPPDWCPLRGAR